MSNKVCDDLSNLNLMNVVYVAIGLGVFFGIVILILSYIMALNIQTRAKLKPINKTGLDDNGRSPIENTITKLKLEGQLDRINFPKYFICPHTLGVMLNPVCNMHGITVDRAPYQQYLSANYNRDPLTGQRLTDTDLFPNVVLRAQIITFLEDYARNRPRYILERFTFGSLQSMQTAFRDMWQDPMSTVGNMLYSFRTQLSGGRGLGSDSQHLLTATARLEP